MGKTVGENLGSTVLIGEVRRCTHTRAFAAQQPDLRARHGCAKRILYLDGDEELAGRAAEVCGLPPVAESSGPPFELPPQPPVPTRSDARAATMPDRVLSRRAAPPRVCRCRSLLLIAVSPELLS